MTLTSINPATGNILHEYTTLQREAVEERLRKASEEQKAWSRLDFSQRGQFFLRCAELLEKNKESLSLTITQEMGKCIKESKAEVLKCALVCRYYASHSAEFLKNEVLPTEDVESYISYQPLGIILGIMPWNFPFWQVFRFAVPAMMGGNAVLLKHANNVSGCSVAIAKIFEEAGFPEGIFNNLLLDIPQVEGVIQHPLVAAVSLTGSERAGVAVASQAGKVLKKTVLELGGSDPFIVFPEANRELVLINALKSRMLNAGQSCIAAKRFIVHEEVYDDILAEYSHRLASLKLGDPEHEDTDMGPMARVDLAENLAKQVQASLDAGATLAYQGDTSHVQGGAYYPPTVLGNVRPGMPAYHEELFGPVASFIKFRDYEEAVAIANESAYGLGASIWTRDLPLARKMAIEIESGAVFINQMVASRPELPFGGIKKSGYGRELSHLGIREFMNTKTVVVQP